MSDTMTLADELYAAGFSDGRHSRDYDPRGCQEWQSAVDAVVDLKPLAELLGCEPETEAIENAVRALKVKESRAFVSGRNAARRETVMTKSAAHAIYTAIAQALNWERTEFDTLDELLEELRKRVKNHTEFVNSAYLDRALLGKLRDKVLAADGASDVAWTFAIQDVGQMLLDSCDQHSPSGFAEGGYVKVLPEHEVAAVLHPVTHTLLHAGEMYREVTILLHTEQLVAWRTADGQEYSAPAHQVTLDPDEDGLAAALLTRIAGVEIAPEHMAELRAQMAGGLADGR